MRELEPGQVAGEDPVAVERALGRPRRAGRVDEERRRLRRRRGRLERGRRGREQPVEVAVDVDQGAVEAERLHPLQRLALAEHDPRLRVAQPDVECVRAERGAERHGDRAELVGRDVRDRGLGALREHDRDAVAGHGAGRGQDVGEPPSSSRSARRSVTVRVSSRPSVTRIAGACLGCRSATSTPRLSRGGSAQRWERRSSSYVGAAGHVASSEIPSRATRKPMCGERRPGALRLRAAQRRCRHVGLAYEPPRRTRACGDRGSSRPSPVSYG